MNEQQVRPKSPFKIVLIVGIVMLLVGLGIGASSVQTKTIVDRSTVTQTITGLTVTETVKKTIEGSTVTITVTKEAQSSMEDKSSEEWSTLIAFQGIDDKTTENFYVPTDYWRVKYTVDAENNEYAFFGLSVKPYVTSIDFHKSGSDVSYIHEGPGEYHIEVFAANLNSWSVEVQTQE